jgi:hypothetical protein
MSILENIYRNSDNEAIWIVSDDSGPIDFIANSTTKVDVYLGGILVTSDTSDVSFADGGLITLKLGMNTDLVLNERYPVVLKAYDALHVNGQVLMHPSMGDSNANVVLLPSEVVA